MSGFNDFVQLELPKRPFTDADGAAGQVLARSARPERPRELVWVDVPGIELGLQLPAGTGGVSGHRAIAVNAAGLAVYAAPAQADSFVGISKNAAIAGDMVVIATRDTLLEPTWTWTPGLPVFFAVDGVLTQSVQTLGAVAPVGVALTPTSILISPASPVFFET